MKPLLRELDRWRDEGHEARLWLRDDDAVEPTPALERLIAMSAQHRVPVALAIIPAHAGQALAQRLSRTPLMTPVVHGWSHANHAPPASKKQELGLHRPMPAILAELGLALARMKEIFGDRLAPILVPPWNRIDPAVVAELGALGFTGLSTFADAHADAPLPAINTHVDLIDWRGGRRGREPRSLIADLAEQLRLARLGSGRPVGLLAHHLVHDEGVWCFLDELLAATTPRCRWCGVHDLVG